MCRILLSHFLHKHSRSLEQKSVISWRKNWITNSYIFRMILWFFSGNFHVSCVACLQAHIISNLIGKCPLPETVNVLLSHDIIMIEKNIGLLLGLIRFFFSLCNFSCGPLHKLNLTFMLVSIKHDFLRDKNVPFVKILQNHWKNQLKTEGPEKLIT